VHFQVVIPTRNRAKLAMNSVRAVLAEKLPNVSVMVSDNSTQADGVAELSAFCHRLGAPVRYVQPPAPAAMAPHFEWAIQQAMQNEKATHFTYLSDRMVFRPGSIRQLMKIGSRLPGKVFSYDHDLIDDFHRPVRLHEFRWSGRLVEVDAPYLLELAAKSEHPPCNPRILNSFIPRAIFDAVRSRFGNVFDSISPDFCFCYRCLDIVDSIVYWDRSILLNYAYDRSNGAGYLRGIDSADSADFQKQLGSSPMNRDALIPEFHTITNAVMNEYCFVKKESKSGRFPEVDRASYLRAMARDIEDIEEPRLRAAQRELLVREGGTPMPVGKTRLGAQVQKALKDPLRTARQVARRTLVNSRTQPLWQRAGEMGIAPPSSVWLEFASADEALQWTYRFPRRPTRQLRRLDFMRDREHVREVSPETGARA